MMPSPFPGMDPFIEGQKWSDFHHEFLSVMRELLVPRVRPRYEVIVEERVYVEHHANEMPASIYADVAVVERERIEAAPHAEVADADAVTVAPVLLTLSIPQRKREFYIAIHYRQTGEVVTIIYVLSPSNKRAGGDGRWEYLAKRESVLRSSTHLVELDLLRGGERLPTVEPLPPADYYAFVCREQRRPKAEVYFWVLSHRLPSIPIPLKGDDPDVLVDLQAILDSVYDRAGYDYSLDYQRRAEPPLSKADAGWVEQVIARFERNFSLRNRLAK